MATLNYQRFQWRELATFSFSETLGESKFKNSVYLPVSSFTIFKFQIV